MVAIKGEGSTHLSYLFFIDQFDGPNDGITSYPTLITQLAITPTSYPSLPPAIGLLLRLSTEWWPPKVWAQPLSSFLNELCFGTPSNGTSRSDCKPTTKRLHQIHGESWQHDLGQLWMLPWRERVKPLECWLGAAHVVVC
jgi:hypothetical protein